MNKKRGIIFLLVGTVLLVSALSLFFYNQYEDNKAGQTAENLLVGVQEVIREKEIDNSQQTDIQSDKNLPPELPVTEVEGYEYVGYLSIPALDLKLPVMSQWDYDRLKISPCRQFGSSRTDDLVIAAHNYKKHFGYLSKLEIGDSVFFTDMDGIKNAYKVSLVDTLSPTEVERVQNSNYDLVLYTCTHGGQSRVAVFCNKNI